MIAERSCRDSRACSRTGRGVWFGMSRSSARSWHTANRTQAAVTSIVCGARGFKRAGCCAGMPRMRRLPAHVSLWWYTTVEGRFSRYEGTLHLSGQPAIELTIEADSLDTKNDKRDKHLRSPDVFRRRGAPVHPLRVTERG